LQYDKSTDLALGHNKLEKLVTDGMYLMKSLCQVINMWAIPPNWQCGWYWLELLSESPTEPMKIS